MRGRSQKIGSGFEGFFEASCNRQGFSWIHIPLGARIYGRDRFGKPLTHLVKAPFDYAIAGILNGLPVAAYIDTKTVAGKSFPKSNIDDNQIDNLVNFERMGHPSGYLIYFREVQKIVFVSAALIKEKNSVIKPQDGKELGDLFDFDLKKMWD